MDIRQYKSQIKSKLMDGLNKQAKLSNQMRTGELPRRKEPESYDPQELIQKYNDKCKDYDMLVRKFQKHKIPVVNMNGGDIYDTDSDDGYDNNSDFEGGKFKMSKAVKKMMTKKTIAKIDNSTVEGGKFHFAKSMKRFGKDMGTAVKKAGINQVANDVAKEGWKAIKSNASSFMKGAEELAPVIGEEALETAPLLLAAGIKKPRKKREISQKERNRHALIRELMEENDCSLAQASKYIKANKIEY